jgi:hypothetical protein
LTLSAAVGAGSSRAGVPRSWSSDRSLCIGSRDFRLLGQMGPSGRGHVSRLNAISSRSRSPTGPARPPDRFLGNSLAGHDDTAISSSVPLQLGTNFGQARLLEGSCLYSVGMSPRSAQRAPSPTNLSTCQKNLTQCPAVHG